MKTLQEKCPQCQNDDIKVEICEDFLDDREWIEYECNGCGHKWEKGEPDEQ